MNNNRCYCERCRKKNCILRFPICINRCNCSKCRKKKCILRFPVCIECPSDQLGSSNSPEPQGPQDNLELM